MTRKERPTIEYSVPYFRRETFVLFFVAIIFILVRSRLIHYLCLIRRFFLNFSGFNVAFHLKLCVNVFWLQLLRFSLQHSVGFETHFGLVRIRHQNCYKFFFIFKNLIMHLCKLRAFEKHVFVYRLYNSSRIVCIRTAIKCLT